MKSDPTKTFGSSIVSDAYAKQFRNQATGVSPCRATSEAQGAGRSTRVIDCAPDTQLACADRSYPRPAPSVDPLTGKLIDRATGKRYVADADQPPSTWTR